MTRILWPTPSTIVISILLLGLLAPPAVAQSSTGTLYRLEAGSVFERGCFPPCDCPLASGPLEGTYRLALITVGDVFDFYEVSDVRWKTRRNTEDILVTGSGSYKVSPIINQHEMTLDLSVGGAPVETYASDTVDLTSELPRIDIVVSLHGGTCFDTVVRLRSRPAIRLHADGDSLDWDWVPQTDGYDLVRGSLTRLQETGGAFDLATEECLGSHLQSTSFPYGTVPPASEGWWFLVRAAGDTYDEPNPFQVAPRDAEIAASPAACP